MFMGGSQWYIAESVHNKDYNYIENRSKWGTEKRQIWCEKEMRHCFSLEETGKRNRDV
jgi:hypothetical protein